MNQKTRNLTGWILSGLMSLALGASAIDKIYLSAHALEMGTSFGLSGAAYRMLGVIEISSVLLFLIPRTGVLGMLLLSSYLGGAIATHLQHNQDMLFPAVMESLIWIGGCLRFPELTQRMFQGNRQKG
jgi:hypothetical protein